MLFRSVTVRTKRFKNWFGDWEKDKKNASKVVDENGEPLVVYHGTGSFSEFAKTHTFSEEKLGEATKSASAKKGFFFAKSKGTSAEYAGLEGIEPPFRDWMSPPSNLNEAIGDIRYMLFSVDAKYVPKSVWDAYGEFVDKIFKAKTDRKSTRLNSSHT